MPATVIVQQGDLVIQQGEFRLVSPVGPHMAPATAWANTAEGADVSGPTSINIFPTQFIGDLMLAVFTSNALPSTFSLNTPSTGTAGPWTLLFNGTMDTDDSNKCAVWARVAAATDFTAVSFTTAGAAFAQSCAELYRIPAGSHSVSDPGTDMTFTMASGTASGTGTFPAITVPNSHRLAYLACYFGNNGNFFTPHPPAGQTVINTNGAGDASADLFDVTDQSTDGAKSSFNVTFASANADYRFFALTHK